MAIFLPELHSKNLRLTAGERRFGTCLYRNLEDDYHCWINVPIGPKQLRPDFVVLHPGRGILALEVKDWKLATIAEVDRLVWKIHTDHGLKPKANPLEQARGYATAIADLLEHDPLLVSQEQGRYKGHLLLPWGFGVVLTNITRRQFDTAGLEAVIPSDKVICQDEIAEGVDAETLQSRLWGMFQYSFGGVLSLARIDRIRWHLFPEIRIQQGGLFDDAAPAPIGAASIAKVLPDIIKVMDLEQEKFARNLGEGHRLIHGVAGSGKTMLLAFRCLHLTEMEQAKPILVLCYNKTLAARLREMLASRGVGNNVQIRHFHGWCSDMCNLYQLDLDHQSNLPAYTLQVEAVMKGVEKGRVPRAQYAAILIDEGHDFEAEWFTLLVQMLDPQTNSLLLLYDDTQNIYGKSKRRSFTWASVGVNASGKGSRRAIILKKNYRNTVEALNFSYEFISTYLGDAQGTEDMPIIKPELGGRTGQKPEVKRFEGISEELDYVSQWIAQRVGQGFAYSEIVVLFRLNWQIDQFGKELRRRGIPTTTIIGKHNKKVGVTLLTMHASKGLEFPCVCLPDLSCMPYPGVEIDEEARLLYVAMTRSTDRMLVTFHRESEFTRQCERMVAEETATQ